MEVFLIILGLLSAISHGVLASTGPCFITGTGYESFITDVPEDTPVGSVLGKLNVTGGPGVVNLSQETNTFLQLDQVSRNITLMMPLDTDKGPGTIILLVKCREINDFVSQSISLTVRVILQDVNDNPPIFSHANYVINVTENTEVGTTIYRDAKATDSDQRGGGNDQISYRILPGMYAHYFVIEYPLYPDIKLIKSLDFEMLHTMTVVIEAQDIPVRGESMNGTANLTVNVVDVDDLSPTFTSDYYTGSITVNATRGTEVSVLPVIKASDRDQLNTPVKYEMTDRSAHFLIDQSTGIVTVDSKLSETTYSALLMATQVDNPLRFGVAMLQIIVSGHNITIPNGPSFQQTLYETNISESQPPGTIIMTVPVTVRNVIGTLSYTILESILAFAVDQRGNIFLREPLDYDGPDKEYRFTLQVADGVHMASTSIHIHVENVNDNSPVLRNPQYQVDSERVQGAIITVIQGQDKDPNTQLQFQLKTHRSLFSINSLGDISITGSPEELVQDSYLLVVSVSDDGKPMRSSIALVTVRFPSLGGVVLQQGCEATAGNDILVIVLGAIAAVLFVIIIILIVYIIRRKMSYTDEQLTKARLHDGLDPQGLTYKAGDPGPDPVVLKFDGELEETSDVDGATTIQENPLSDDRMNYGFSNHSHDGSGEIQLDTAVIPYGPSFNNYEERRAYQNGVLKTFHVPEGSSSGESSNSDSTGDSNRGLMKIRTHKSSSLSKGKKLSWGDNSDRVSAYNSEETLPKEMRKSKEKPEITVYF